MCAGREPVPRGVGATSRHPGIVFSEQPVVKCIWVGPDPLVGFHQRTIEGENAALYNARTPETGTNHLGGSFDSFDAKAVTTAIKPAEANPKPIVMGRGFLRALF